MSAIAVLLPGHAAIGEACPFRSKSNTAFAFVKVFGDEKINIDNESQVCMHHVVVRCSLQAMPMTLAMTLAGGSKCDNT